MTSCPTSAKSRVAYTAGCAARSMIRAMRPPSFALLRLGSGQLHRRRSQPHDDRAILLAELRLAGDVEAETRAPLAGGDVDQLMADLQPIADRDGRQPLDLVACVPRIRVVRGQGHPF